MSHPNPAGRLGDLLERETLGSWCNTMAVLDLADLRDSLRAQMTDAQDLAAGARWRHDWAAAASHRTDADALGQLVGIIDDELSWRRAMCYQHRPWPLGRRAGPG